MSEASVQLAPDSTGKKVRTLEVTTPQPDGTFATVEMQVVSIADSQGNVLSLETATIADLLRNTNALLRAISFQLSFLNTPRMSVDESIFYEQPLVG